MHGRRKLKRVLPGIHYIKTATRMLRKFEKKNVERQRLNQAIYSSLFTLYGVYVSRHRYLKTRTIMHLTGLGIGHSTYLHVIGVLR